MTLDTDLARGGWRRQLVLAAADTLEVLELGELGPVQVPDWDGYEQIVLVVTNTDLTGIGFDYSVTVAYDPDLVGGDAPVVLWLGYGYPNPFRPAVHDRVFLPYELDQASHSTRLFLFSADGQLLRRFDLGQRARRAYQQVWDGCNEDGEMVGSGIYYWVLEADGRVRARSLAVVRE